LQPTWT